MFSTTTKPVKLAHKSFEPTLGIKHDVPILFLHGITASKEHWFEIPQIVADATSRKVYAVDARDHGDSEWSDDFSFDANIIDTLHFIDEIKAEKVILVGHSMGGVTSIKSALRAPDKIEKIIVEDMGVKRPSNNRLKIIKMYQQLAQEAVKVVPPGISEKDAKKIIADFIYNAVPEALKPFAISKEKDPRLNLKQNPDGSWNYKTNLKALENALSKGNAISEEPKGVYTGPAYFIYGKESPIKVGEDEKTIKSFFPNAVFVGIENASHSVHTDAPLPFTEALLKFLKE
ncbi:sn-1-specific diacylglycerol lipase ABHD11 [Parasteatoda tepidariorum]|uniref:sn-1-specific diacylglycerol lipase ABHD11 n=1 Tax=Parasteatoda tepidariorum TaxID=114398 RepID=UPI00077FB378|nr:protein ABHD11-like [Parasteatoda tepidariorum]XP_042906246.1 protein ABHD11-like [Parasteatoda tepidariorum]